MNDLIQRLANPAPVACMRPEKSAAALQECIGRNYVHLLFTDTGTELGVQLYRPECNLAVTDASKLGLVGALTLNYVRVKCIAEIDPATCEGTARLVPVGDEEYQALLAG